MFKLRPDTSRENLDEEIKMTCEVLVLNNLSFMAMSSDGHNRFSVKSSFYWCKNMFFTTYSRQTTSLSRQFWHYISMAMRDFQSALDECLDASFESISEISYLEWYFSQTFIFIVHNSQKSIYKLVPMVPILYKCHVITEIH